MRDSCPNRNHCPSQEMWSYERDGRWWGWSFARGSTVMPKLGQSLTLGQCWPGVNVDLFKTCLESLEDTSYQSLAHIIVYPFIVSISIRRLFSSYLWSMNWYNNCVSNQSFWCHSLRFYSMTYSFEIVQRLDHEWSNVTGSRFLPMKTACYLLPLIMTPTHSI